MNKIMENNKCPTLRKLGVIRKKEETRRFWVSWYSTYHIKYKCTTPPFKIWESGYCDNPADEDIDLSTWCAVIEANSEQEIWQVIKNHFPDYEERFCEERNSDWEPNDRFPEFDENKISL